MEAFETNTILNEATLKEIKYRLVPRQRTVLLVSILVALCLLLFAIAVRVAFTAWVAAAGLVVFIVEYFLISHRNVKVILKRMKESGHVDAYHYTTSFTDSGMLIVNHTLDTDGTIFYQDIKYMEASKRFFIVVTRAGQFALLDRTAINAAGKTDALRALLRDRCPGLRWKGGG